MNLLVRNAFFPRKNGKPEETAVNKVLASGRAIVSHLRHSNKATEIFRDIQKQKGLDQHQLIQVDFLCKALTVS